MPTSVRTRDWALVAALFAGLLVVGAVLGPVTSTETRYALSGREMLESGDWVVPTMNGGPLLEKPPLVYWVVAAGYAVLGVGDVSARVPGLLAGAACLALVALGAARLAARTGGDPATAGRTAFVALATMPAFLIQAYTISIDVWLVLSTTAAGVALLLARFEPERRLRWALLVHAALGVGMLAKGPLAIVLVLVPTLVAAAARREWRLLRPFAHPLGLLLFAAISVPWYLAADARLPGLLERLVRRRLFGGLGSSTEFHARGVWTVWVPFVGTLPWLGAVPAAALAVWRRGADARTTLLLVSLLAVAASVLFSFSASRLVSYASPGLPWVAMLVALGRPTAAEAEARGPAPGWWRGLAAGTAVLAVGIGAVGALLAVVTSPPAWVVLAYGVATLAGIATVAWRRRAAGPSGPLARSFARPVVAATCALAAAAVALLGLPRLVKAEGPLWPPLAALRKPGEALGAALRANDSWAFLPWRAGEHVAYFGYPSALVVVPPEASSPATYRRLSDLDAWMRSPERRWLMIRVADEKKKLRVPVWVVSRGPKYEIVTNLPLPPPGP